MAPAADLPESEAAGDAAATAPAADGAGESTGMVKVELDDPEKAAAAAAAEEEEGADYGGAEEPPPPAQAAGPLRSMPDYGDLIDDPEGGQRPTPARGDVKSEAATKAEARPTGIHVFGVQRLTRSHLEEVFHAKGLQCFIRTEWLSDDAVICIFRSGEEAASVLAGLRTGFDDAMTQNDAPPGPGLWRAQRSMLEFREATTADVPDPVNRRLHRAGRQVREYRFWEAMKDQTKSILAAEDAKGQKRMLPSGEDAIGAAEWDDYGMPPGKRRRVGQAAMSDEEPIDMLEEMAKQDKVILTKTEEGDTQISKTSNETSLVNPPIQEETWATGRWREGGGGKWGNSWRQDNSGWRNNRGSWQNDSRGGNWQHDDRRGNGQGGGGSWKSGGDERKRRRGPGGGQSRGPAEVLGAEPASALDEEERAKRARRGDRFGGRGGDPIAAKEEVPAR